MNFRVRMFVKSAVIDASLIICEVCDVNYRASSQAGSLFAEVSVCLVVRDLCQTRQTETSASGIRIPQLQCRQEEVTITE